ncbi:MAG: hypothetical protein CM1200mP2_01150 [Planctomycetaceae bacterium]|nr:MAG: hypothetical protein CM1200mP2_01150 [Planctomycetaceae bacterium]
MASKTAVGNSPPNASVTCSMGSRPSSPERIVWPTPNRSRQKASRRGLMSSTVTWPPAIWANCVTARPMGPAPITSTSSPSVTPLRSTAWAPMPSVSTRASCSRVSWSLWCSLLAGTTISCRIPPSTWTPRPFKRTAAVGSSGTAGAAVPAVEVGFNGTVISHRKPETPSPNSSTSTPSSWPSTRG